MKLSRLVPSRAAFKRMTIAFFIGNSADDLDRMRYRDPLTEWVETIWGFGMIVVFIAAAVGITRLIQYLNA